MAALVHLIDESASGQTLHRATLRLASERISVRELITRRITSEVERYNANLGQGMFAGLVRPSADEQMLNGPKRKKARPVDLAKQLETAMRAFEGNGFFMLLDDRQLESLDEEITLTDGASVSFVKLVPLVGG